MDFYLKKFQWKRGIASRFSTLSIPFLIDISLEISFQTINSKIASLKERDLLNKIRIGFFIVDKCIITFIILITYRIDIMGYRLTWELRTLQILLFSLSLTTKKTNFEDNKKKKYNNLIGVYNS